ncbi:dopamine D2-like receptor isoform X2 [Malaya genurostris]|uniref:dopamine D2-like receptor isoform X2 n=1 Tax=Malaya genurostris TaxID=325434 RepID=UPI0026F39380|nr:dopamine D2-like receptor isoform X2 [Malaya genurostris]
MASIKITFSACLICFALISICEGQRRRPRPDVQALKNAIRQKVLEDIAKKHGVTLPVSTTEATTEAATTAAATTAATTTAAATTAAATTAAATTAAATTAAATTAAATTAAATTAAATTNGK